MLLHSFHSDCNVLSINLSSDFLITINFSSLQLLSFFLSDLQELEGSSPGLLFPFSAEEGEMMKNMDSKLKKRLCDCSPTCISVIAESTIRSHKRRGIHLITLIPRDSFCSFFFFFFFFFFFSLSNYLSSCSTPHSS